MAGVEYKYDFSQDSQRDKDWKSDSGKVSITRRLNLSWIIKTIKGLHKYFHPILLLLYFAVPYNTAFAGISIKFKALVKFITVVNWNEKDNYL